MKHGVSTYSFDQLLSAGATLAQVIAKAGEMGFEGVELANLTENYAYDLDELKEAARSAGVELYSWATSSDFAKDIGAQIAFLRSEIDKAAYLGCRVLRTDIYHEEVSDPYNPAVIAAVRTVADYAAEKGLTLVTENHGGYLVTPERLEAFFCAVNHPNFGLLCDFANFADADVAPDRAVNVLKGRIRHVHMKDCHLLDGERLWPGTGWYVTRGGNYWRCAMAGHGNLPLYKCLKTLALAGYDGYLMQEFEGVENCEFALSEGLQFAKRALAAIPQGIWPEA